MSKFVSFAQAAARIEGKMVAVVGSAPSVLQNEPGFIDSQEVVVRVNNHKLGKVQGIRTDVHYSFYGHSISSRREDLMEQGVQLCMCKCPNSKPINSDWHERHQKLMGIDFRYIYQAREDWWFCDTYVPDDKSFLEKFNLLGQHIPTTGFAAILDILKCKPKSVFLTGFDFFSSGLHNVNETWRPGNPNDPIGHVPDLEAAWLKGNLSWHPIVLDKSLRNAFRI